MGRLALTIAGVAPPTSRFFDASTDALTAAKLDVEVRKASVPYCICHSFEVSLTKIISSVGKNIRKMCSSRATECPVKIVAKVQKKYVGIEVEYEVVISAAVTTHNHEIGPRFWQFYAENRRITSPHLLEMVGFLRKGGSSIKKIIECIRENTGTEFAHLSNFIHLF